MLQDVGMERAALACMCQYGADAYFDVGDILSPNTFTVDSNQIIFKCIKSIYDEDAETKLDPVLIYGKAKSLGVGEYFNQKVERDHLKALFSLPVDSSNAGKYAGKIRRLEIARLGHSQVQDIQQTLEKLTGDEPVDAILNIIEQPIFDFTTLLNTGSNNEPTLLGEGARDWWENIKANPRDIIGVSSGYGLFDHYIGGGFRRGTVNLIGARTKVGKSLLSVNIGYHVAKNVGIPVLYLDTEMGKKDNWPRVLARTSKVTIDDIETGKAVKDKAAARRVDVAIDELEKLGFSYMSIAGRPFEEIVGIMRRWIMKKVGYDTNGKIKDCLIIFDYVKLMSDAGLGPSMQEYQKLGFIMTGLHNFMARYDVPCLAFAQLNRDGITKESTDAVSGSDRLIWLCTNFSIYKYKSDEEIAEDGIENGNRKLVVVVARHGKGMEEKDYINMFMRGEYGEIVEGKTKRGLGNKKAAKDFKVDGGFNEDVPFGT
jgi:replicative DNA helicase